MEHDLPKFDNSDEIAKYLIEEVGLDHALEIAMEEITRANEEREYYLLSIWREVRSDLRDRVETVGQVN